MGACWFPYESRRRKNSSLVMMRYVGWEWVWGEESWPVDMLHLQGLRTVLRRILLAA